MDGKSNERKNQSLTLTHPKEGRNGREGKENRGERQRADFAANQSLLLSTSFSHLSFVHSSYSTLISTLFLRKKERWERQVYKDWSIMITALFDDLDMRERGEREREGSGMIFVSDFLHLISLFPSSPWIHSHSSSSFPSLSHWNFCSYSYSPHQSWSGRWDSREGERHGDERRKWRDRKTDRLIRGHCLSLSLSLSLPVLSVSFTDCKCRQDFFVPSLVLIPLFVSCISLTFSVLSLIQRVISKNWFSFHFFSIHKFLSFDWWVFNMKSGRNKELGDRREKWSKYRWRNKVVAQTGRESKMRPYSIITRLSFCHRLSLSLTQNINLGKRLERNKWNHTLKIVK